MNYKNIVLIKNIYTILLELDIPQNHLNEIVSFYELREQFLNLNNEWRYVFHIDEKLLTSLYACLKSYKQNKSDRKLIILEDISKKIMDGLAQIISDNSISDSYLEEEIVLRKELSKIFENKNKEVELDRLMEKFKSIEGIQVSIEQKNEVIDREYVKVIENLNKFEEKHSKFNVLIDRKSNSAIKNLYIDIYEREIEIADKYRNWALIIFAFVGLILLLGFLNFSIQNWNHLRSNVYIHIPLGWDSVLKTLMLFSLTTPAWYLTKESSKHRKVAYKAQMLGTELASFPLYVRELKDEDRLDLRKHLADRFFGQELFNDSKNASSSDNSLEQIKLLTEANKVLAEALKAKKAVE